MMSNGQQRNEWSKPWAIAALLWALLLCFAPDPRPLATPAWSIHLVTSALHVQEAAARVIAAIALRMLFLGVLGMLMMRATGVRRFRPGAWAMLLLAPMAGILTLWVNHGHFPIAPQLKLAVVATVAGALATLLLRRNWWAGIALIAVLGLTYGQLTSYSTSDDMAQATRVQVAHIFKLAPTLPQGDSSFIMLVNEAFTLAEQRSRAGDPVLENQAAVLGLALVLGDEKLAKVADRYVDPVKIPLCETIRARTTLQQRADWSRHFWVSAGLYVLSGSSRTLSVGVIKELKDANAGGSGFSFGDLTADAAGERLAEVATTDVPSAVAMQQRLGAISNTSELMPDVHDLPEGIHADEFEEKYGGAGGALTDSLVAVITDRLRSCAALQMQDTKR